MDQYLAPTSFLDSDHPRVIEFADRAIREATDPRERAVRLFYAVRDGWRYDPYSSEREPEKYKASAILDQPTGWCVSKSVLLTALARAAGIPARLGFADVRNHLTSEKLLERMGTDVFIFHGYTEFLLEGKWVKASSAFNIEMCERFGTKPLEFDGAHDSLMHEFDNAGQRHMEYVKQRGSYADLPLDEILSTFAELYPQWQFTPEPVVDAAFHG